MNARTPRIPLAVLAGTLLSIGASAWSPTPAAAAVRVFVPPTSETPSLTVIRFNCSFRGSPDGSRTLIARSTPFGPKRLSITVPSWDPNSHIRLRYGASATDARVTVTVPGGAYTNANAGPPGSTVAGAMDYRGDILNISTAALYNAGGNGAARVSGSARCESPQNAPPAARRR